MKQKSVVLFLQPKSLVRKVIRHELVAVVQEPAISYSSATRFSRETILGRNSEEASSAIIAQR
jgi:hypothetical protein